MLSDCEATTGDRGDAAPRKPIHIAIVDDHPLLRAGIVATFKAHPVFEVRAEGATAVEALAIAERELPDLMLIDLSIPGDGIEAIRRLSHRFPAIQIVVLTVSEDTDIIEQSLLAGAVGYLSKGISGEALAEAAQRIVSGDYLIPPAVARGLLNVVSGRGGGSERVALGTREHAVLERLAKGHPVQEVATELDMQDAAVRNCATNILRKLHLRSRIEAALHSNKSN